MRSGKDSTGLKAIITLVLVICSAQAWAAKSRIIHEFKSNGGGWPAGVIFDSAGNLYGVTIIGGPTRSSYGSVFELSPTATGGWHQTRSYVFHGGSDGYYPNEDLIMDAAGNLYGTVQIGPSGSAGGAFELSPNGNNSWNETILYSLPYVEAGLPCAGFIRDAAGNLYSTGWNGGAHGLGAVFELSPAGGGAWTETTLHSFNGSDGSHINDTILSDSSGNLYGTSLDGGSVGAGVVWELSPETGGTWSFKVIHDFGSGKDGVTPYNLGGLKIDSAGNLYGTTEYGGMFGKGEVFELTPNGDGTWAEKVLYNFTGAGSSPQTGVVFDAAGNMYGETYVGGAGNCGNVYELSPAAGGSWTYHVLRSFHGSDGCNPWMGIKFDSAGNMYGTTRFGGTYGNGVVFEIFAEVGQAKR